MPTTRGKPSHLISTTIRFICGLSLIHHSHDDYSFSDEFPPSHIYQLWRLPGCHFIKFANSQFTKHSTFINAFNHIAQPGPSQPIPRRQYQFKIDERIIKFAGNFQFIKLGKRD